MQDQNQTQNETADVVSNQPKLNKKPLYIKPLSKPVTIEASIFTIFDSCIPGGMISYPAKTESKS